MFAYLLQLHLLRSPSFHRWSFLDETVKDDVFTSDGHIAGGSVVSAFDDAVRVTVFVRIDFRSQIM